MKRLTIVQENSSFTKASAFMTGMRQSTDFCPFKR